MQNLFATNYLKNKNGADRGNLDLYEVASGCSIQILYTVMIVMYVADISAVKNSLNVISDFFFEIITFKKGALKIFGSASAVMRKNN